MKSQTKHTPGPWQADEMDGRIYITPQGRMCHYIADINSKEMDPEGDYPTRSQRRANAALIAAAPELLKAAKGLLLDAQDREETHDDDGKEYDDFKALRLAIVKAEAL